MIKYALQCENGHQFDGWFSNSESFDTQKAQGFVTCVVCGTSHVEKMLMAPNVTGTKKTDLNEVPTEAPAPDGPGSPAVVSDVPAPPQVHPMPQMPSAPHAAPQQILPPPDVMVEIVEKIREVRKFVEANHENVGTKFADEARKIHYGEEEPRGIFGESTLDEAAELMEEGIDILPLPRLPEENN